MLRLAEGLVWLRLLRVSQTRLARLHLSLHLLPDAPRSPIEALQLCMPGLSLQQNAEDWLHMASSASSGAK